ncbi:unnamed protein product [Urochloa decumbens]|uniref:F-box domain-containing protein n=1 Tax=Urochloa decumbens TaxID=240449 RepID=A0ABC9FRL0_9POAL
MPSLTLLAAAEAAPLRLRRRRQPRESVTLPLSVFRSLALPGRDWAGLPPKLISCILRKLDPVQIMLGADKVCRSWRRAARDEPELWRRVDMRGHEELARRNMADLNQIAADAVRRSQGQCEAFTAERTTLSVTDGFLRFLGNQEAMAIATMHGICSLQLVHNNLITNQGLVAILDNCPRIESLEIRKCCNIIIDDALRAKCAQIKSLKLVPYDPAREYYEDDFEPLPVSECSTCRDYFKKNNRERYQESWVTTDINVEEHMVTATVHELRSLELYHNDLTRQGLVAILEKLPYLEYFDICNCRNIIKNNIATMRNLLGNKYPRSWLVKIKTKKLTIKLLSSEYDSRYKYNHFIPRQKIKKYHSNEASKRLKGSFSSKEFYREELQPRMPTLECSTCLMIEYFAKRYDWLDLDDLSDYYDPSYGLGNHDEIDFQVDDRMVGKRLRRYLKTGMEVI